MVEPLPAWVDPTRLESQQHIVSDVVDRFRGRNGHPINDVVFLQAPTGVGKTLIAELIARKLGAKTIYSCTTKALQDQFVRDFPYAKVLKGRRNYLTTMGMVGEMGEEVDSIDEAVTAHDCTFNYETGICGWCDNRNHCPYIRARGAATSARLAVLNSSYLLTDSGGPRRFSNRDLYVLDEADVLESELLNHTELHLTNRRMERLHISPPKYKTKDDTWAMWINDEALPKSQEYLDTLPILEEATDRQTIREIKYMGDLVAQMRRVRLAIPRGKWVYDGYQHRGDVIFRPVFVREHGEELLWQNGRKFLVMSATILTGDVMADELGLTLTGRAYDLLDVPSNFPAENRPVHVVPLADVTNTNKDTERPKLARAINGVLKRHQDERILIHTVSYELALYLYEVLRHHVPGSGIDDHSRRRLVTYTNSRAKDAALEEYKAYPGAVLIAASMDRGVDLPNDLCRVQVIAKVPWPNKGDKRVGARLYAPGGGNWYAMHAIRTIIQMAGRAVRHREDYAITYILDKQFAENLWKNHQRMFPRYFREALNFRFNPRLLTEV